MLWGMPWWFNKVLWRPLQIEPLPSPGRRWVYNLIATWILNDMHACSFASMNVILININMLGSLLECTQVTFKLMEFCQLQFYPPWENGLRYITKNAYASFSETRDADCDWHSRGVRRDNHYSDMRIFRWIALHWRQLCLETERRPCRWSRY